MIRDPAGSAEGAPLRVLRDLSQEPGEARTPPLDGGLREQIRGVLEHHGDGVVLRLKDDVQLVPGHTPDRRSRVGGGVVTTVNSTVGNGKSPVCGETSSTTSVSGNSWWSNAVNSVPPSCVTRPAKVSASPIRARSRTASPGPAAHPGQPGGERRRQHGGGGWCPDVSRCPRSGGVSRRRRPRCAGRPGRTTPSSCSARAISANRVVRAGSRVSRPARCALYSSCRSRQMSPRDQPSQMAWWNTVTRIQRSAPRRARRKRNSGARSIANAGDACSRHHRSTEAVSSAGAERSVTGRSTGTSASIPTTHAPPSRRTARQRSA